MSPLWSAVRAGVRRGTIELKQSFTNRQDLIGQLVWVGVLLASMFLLRDHALGGARVSVGAFMLPSLVGMSVGFNGVIGLAQMLTVEREDGTLLRAKVVPNGMTGYLVGKIVTASGSVLVNVAAVLVPGALLLDGVAPRGAVGVLTLLWVLALGLVATLPIGAVIGSLVGTPRSLGLIMLPMMGLVSISGIFFPLTSMPGWLQTVGQLFPFYWLGLGTRSALLPQGAVAVEAGGDWRHLETAGALGLWAVLGLALAPAVLRRMARRESGSAVALRRDKALQRLG
ncbi:ABC transporter permease [Kitasatospora sp. HPMI-4]|uniref:ABC transporter permease n=1 Tax=Kitasatospora sp. HPMI-4 TaxID=3448443 RepID=UPI003F1CB9AF